MLRRILFLLALAAVAIYAQHAAQLDVQSSIPAGAWEWVFFITAAMAALMALTFFVTERAALFISTALLLLSGTTMIVIDGIVNWPYVQFFDDGSALTALSVGAIIVGVQICVFFTSFHALISDAYGNVKKKVGMAHNLFMIISLILTFGIMFAVDRVTKLKNDPTQVNEMRQVKIAALSNLANEYKASKFITSARCRTADCDPTENLTSVTREIGATLDQQITDTKNRTYAFSEIVGPFAAILMHFFRALVLVVGGALLLEWAGYNVAKLMGKTIRPERPQNPATKKSFITRLRDKFPRRLRSTRKINLRRKPDTQQTVMAAKKTAEMPPAAPQITPQNPPQNPPQLRVVPTLPKVAKLAVRKQARSANEIYNDIKNFVIAGKISIKSEHKPTVARDDVRDALEDKSAALDLAVTRWNRDAKKLGKKLLDTKGAA